MIDYGPIAPLTGETVTFDGSGSTDPEGAPLRYEWDLDGDGEFETAGERVTRSYPDNGDRTVTLRVTDANGASATDTATVSIQNRAPTASFDYAPKDPVEGDSVELVASGSSDPDGTITSYEWELTVNEQEYTRTGERISEGSIPAGEYAITLTVTDDDATATDSATIVVGEDTGNDDTGTSLAYPSAYRDQNGGANIPPGGSARGVLSAFGQMQRDNDQYAQFNDNRDTLAVGVATSGIDRSGSNYVLELAYKYDRSSGNPVYAVIVDGSGNVLQYQALQVSSNRRTTSIALNENARSYVQNTGTLYVQYYSSSNPPNLHLYYQRLRVT